MNRLSVKVSGKVVVVDCACHYGGYTAKALLGYGV